MSWWISEVLSTNRDQKQRLCSCECDDMTVIPDPIQYTDDTQTVVEYTIVRGSILYCIENSKTYKLNSQGQWVEQKTGQEIEIGADDITYDNTDSGLTATNVQDAIDELKDENDTQDTAIADLMDNIYGSGTLIPDNANLNSDTYLVPGKYYGNNSAGNTVSGMPIPNRNMHITLTVMQVSPSFTVHIFRSMANSQDPYTYYRKKLSGQEWGNWYRITAEEIVP